MNQLPFLRKKQKVSKFEKFFDFLTKNQNELNHWSLLKLIVNEFKWILFKIILILTTYDITRIVNSILIEYSINKLTDDDQTSLYAISALISIKYFKKLFKFFNQYQKAFYFQDSFWTNGAFSVSS